MRQRRQRGPDLFGDEGRGMVFSAGDAGDDQVGAARVVGLLPAGLEAPGDAVSATTAAMPSEIAETVSAVRAGRR